MDDNNNNGLAPSSNTVCHEGQYLWKNNGNNVLAIDARAHANSHHDHDDDDDGVIITQLLVLLGSSQHEESCCAISVPSSTTTTTTTVSEPKSYSSSTSSSSSEEEEEEEEDSTEETIKPNDAIVDDDDDDDDDNFSRNPFLRCYSIEKLSMSEEKDTTSTNRLRALLLSLPIVPLPSSPRTTTPASFLPYSSSSTSTSISSSCDSTTEIDACLEFSMENIHGAPIVWLRHFQDVFKKLLRRRIDEWRELLINHYGDVADARKLVASLEKGQKKLIVACRGHTNVSDISVISSSSQKLERQQQQQHRPAKKPQLGRTLLEDCFDGGDEEDYDEAQSHTSSVLQSTEEGLGTNTKASLKATTSGNMSDVDSSLTDGQNEMPLSSQQSRTCEFALNLDLLVKLRKGHRSFSTSCYTVHLKAPKMLATYSVYPSVQSSSEMKSSNQNGNLSFVNVSWNDEYDRDGEKNASKGSSAGTMLQAMKHRVEQLALKAVASHASETPGISQRWKSPTFLNKLWNVQEKAETLVPVSRGFLRSSNKKATDRHQMMSDEASVLSIQTSSTLSSLGSKSTSVPYVVSTSSSRSSPTKVAHQQRNWKRTNWFRTIRHVLVFAGLFLASLICLQFHFILHSTASGMWNNFVESASSWTPSLVTMVSSFDRAVAARLPVSSSSSSSPSSRSNLGVSFQRFIHDIPQDETFNFTLSLDDGTDHCVTEDQYGPNNCHYEWNDSVKGSYLVEMEDDKVLTETAIIEVTAMLDNRVPYKVECHLCGQDCVLEIPIFKVHYTIPMPPCPLSLKDRTAKFDFHLWRSSPTDGWLTIPVSASGTVRESPGGAELASFDFHLTAR